MISRSARGRLLAVALPLLACDKEGIETPPLVYPWLSGTFQLVSRDGAAVPVEVASTAGARTLLSEATLKLVPKEWGPIASSVVSTYVVEHVGDGTTTQGAIDGADFRMTGQFTFDMTGGAYLAGSGRLDADTLLTITSGPTAAQGPHVWVFRRTSHDVQP